MPEPDAIIHQALRLQIMAILHAHRHQDAVEFTLLRKLTKATDGNLGSHLATLEKAGYIVIDKDFVGARPRTRVGLSPTGATALRRHLAFLRDVIDTAQDENDGVALPDQSSLS